MNRSYPGSVINCNNSSHHPSLLVIVGSSVEQTSSFLNRTEAGNSVSDVSCCTRLTLYIVLSASAI